MPKLIIDGYNLIYALPGLMDHRRSRLERARERLVAQVAPLAARRKLPTVVVFDGVQDEILPAEANVNEWVQVRFSPPHKKADTIIIELVRTAANPRACTVVTSDKGIITEVLFHGAKTVTSEDFSAVLNPRRRPAPEQEEEVKPEMQPGDLEVWRRIFRGE